jgi:hypothetical protein
MNEQVPGRIRARSHRRGRAADIDRCRVRMNYGYLRLNTGTSELPRCHVGLRHALSSLLSSLTSPADGQPGAGTGECPGAPGTPVQDRARRHPRCSRAADDRRRQTLGRRRDVRHSRVIDRACASARGFGSHASEWRPIAHRASMAGQRRPAEYPDRIHHRKDDAGLRRITDSVQRATASGPTLQTRHSGRRIGMERGGDNEEEHCRQTTI